MAAYSDNRFLLHNTQGMVIRQYNITNANVLDFLFPFRCANWRLPGKAEPIPMGRQDRVRVGLEAGFDQVVDHYTIMD